MDEAQRFGSQGRGGIPGVGNANGRGPEGGLLPPPVSRIVEGSDAMVRRRGRLVNQRAGWGLSHQQKEVCPPPSLPLLIGKDVEVDNDDDE